MVSAHLSNWAPLPDFTGFALAETYFYPSVQFRFLGVSARNALGQMGTGIYFLFWGETTVQALRIGIRMCAID